AVCATEDADGYNVPRAEAIKRAVEVPVMVVGRIHDPAYAEEILQQDKADLIVMARPLLADPELPNKVAAGRQKDIRRCISCENCIDSMFLWPVESKMACAVNAASGRELDLTYRRAHRPPPSLRPRGARPGREAAGVAPLGGNNGLWRGERRRLGASRPLAAPVKGDNGRLVIFLLAQMAALKMDVRRGMTADVAAIKALNPDAVIVATGARL